MNKLLLTLLFLLISQLSFAQLIPEIKWWKTYDGAGNGIDFVNDMKIKNTNIYLAGRSKGLDGSQDLVIMKYSNAGDSLLNIRFISSQNSWDEANAIAIDSSENIYVVGSATFGQSSFYSVLLKYSSTGNLIWSKNYFYYPDSTSVGLEVQFDHLGNPIIGYHQSSAVKFTKYKANGDSLWTTQIKSDTGSYHLNCMLADTLGNIYAAISQTFIIGRPSFKTILLKLNQNGTIDWSKSLVGDTPRKMIIDNDSNLLIVFHGDWKVMKLKPNGDSLWTYEAGGLLTDIVLDKGNNILLSGYTGGIGFFDYMTTKVSTEGIQIWEKLFNSDEDLRDFSSSVAVDNENNVYVTGSAHDMITQGLGYTLKYSSTGELKWKHRFDSPHGIFENPQFIFVNDSNDVILGGDYSDSTNGSNFFVMKIKQVPGTGIDQSNDVLTMQYYLSQNYPNPFNPSTRIEFSIPESAFAKLEVYDVLGRKVKELVNKDLNAGNYTIDFNASELSSGIYYYRLVTKEIMQMKKAVLLK